MKTLRIASRALLCASLLAGCKPAVPIGTIVDTPDGSRQLAPVERAAATDPNQKLTPEQLAAVDPRAMRMQDVAEMMLLYYSVNHDFPQRLEDLLTVADPGTELKLTCPVTGLRYIYIPAGLQSVGRDTRIILHEAEPSQDNGCRWCILSPQRRPGQAPVLEVVLIAPNVFRTYLPLIEQR